MLLKHLSKTFCNVSHLNTNHLGNSSANTNFILETVEVEKTSASAMGILQCLKQVIVDCAVENN